MTDATIEIEAKLVDQMSGALKAIQHEMARLEKTTFESTKGIKNELDALKKKADETKVASSGLSKAVSGWGKDMVAAASGALAGAVAFNTLVGGIRSAIAAANEQRAADKALIAVLEATGNTAGGTFEDLSAYAGQLQKVTKFQDDAVQSAQAMLLTFDRIGKESFPRALEASADLASFLGTDLKSAAQSLGQALQEPEQASRKLRAMNIILTKSQQDQIEGFMKAGEAAKAQDFIFRQLENRIGGHAKNTVTATEVMSNAFGEFAEGGGTAVLGVMESLSTAFLSVIPGFEETTKAIEKANSAAAAGKPVMQAYAMQYQALTGVDLQAAAAIEAANKRLVEAAQAEERQKTKGPNKDQQDLIDKIHAEEKAAAEKLKKDRENEAQEQADLDERAKLNALKREAAFQNRVREASKKEQDEAIKADEARTQQIYESRARMAELQSRIDESGSGEDKSKALDAQHKRELELFTGTEKEKTLLLKAQAAERDRVRQQENESSVQAMGSLFGGLAALARQANMRDRENRLRYKALAIAEATVSTYLAATKALASSPPPFNYIAMAGVIATGLAQVNQIKEQKFEKGGPVYGPSHARGGVRAELEGGEFVLSRGDVNRLGGMEGVQRMREGPTNNWSPVINIQLSGAASPADGQMVADTVLRTLARNMKEIEYRGITG